MLAVRPYGFLGLVFRGEAGAADGVSRETSEEWSKPWAGMSFLTGRMKGKKSRGSLSGRASTVDTAHGTLEASGRLVGSLGLPSVRGVPAGSTTAFLILWLTLGKPGCGLPLTSSWTRS